MGNAMPPFPLRRLLIERHRPSRHFDANDGLAAAIAPSRIGAHRGHRPNRMAELTILRSLRVPETTPIDVCRAHADGTTNLLHKRISYPFPLGGGSAAAVSVDPELDRSLSSPKRCRAVSGANAIQRCEISAGRPTVRPGNPAAPM
jgi:hypothetical protein